MPNPLEDFITTNFEEYVPQGQPGRFLTNYKGNELTVENQDLIKLFTELRNEIKSGTPNLEKIKHFFELVDNSINKIIKAHNLAVDNDPENKKINDIKRSIFFKLNGPNYIKEGTPQEITNLMMQGQVLTGMALKYFREDNPEKDLGKLLNSYYEGEYNKSLDHFKRSLMQILTPQNTIIKNEQDLLKAIGSDSIPSFNALPQNYKNQLATALWQKWNDDIAKYDNDYTKIYGDFLERTKSPQNTIINNKEDLLNAIKGDSNPSFCELPPAYKEKLTTTLWKQWLNNLVEKFFPDTVNATKVSDSESRYETLLRNKAVPEIYEEIQKPSEHEGEKNNFKKQLINFQLENLKDIKSWQMGPLKEFFLKKGLSDDAYFKDGPKSTEQASKAVLTGLQFIILDTKWDLGRFGGERIFDSQTELENKIPKGMNQILKVIEDARVNEKWEEAYDKVEKIIETSKTKGHYFFNERKGTTQEFYNNAKQILQQLREEHKQENVQEHDGVLPQNF